MNYEIDPEFFQGLNLGEPTVTRYSEYILLCQNGDVTPLSYEEWVEFDKKYQEHVRTAASVLSPVTFQRINEVNTNKPTAEQLQSKCEELEAQRDRAIHFKNEAEKELNKLKQAYDQLLVQCDKAAYAPVKELKIPSNQPLYPHYYRAVPNTTHVDIDWILHTWNIGHTVGHAVKKLLCAGQRGVKDKLQDLKEARNSINRAIELEETK